jgi:zinc transporter 1/2/3
MHAHQHTPSLGEEIDKNALLVTKINALVAILIAAMIGGIIPWRWRTVAKSSLLSLGNTFSGGIFLSAGFTHMLSEAVEGFEVSELSEFPLAYFFCMLGIILAMVSERASGHSHGMARDAERGEEDRRAQSGDRKRFAFPRKHENHLFLSSRTHTACFHSLAFALHFALQRTDTFTESASVIGLILSLHSLIEGIALGVSSTTNQTNKVLFAILGHHSFAALALGINILRNENAQQQSNPNPNSNANLNLSANSQSFQIYLKTLMMFSFSTPVGIIIGIFLNGILFGFMQTVVILCVQATASGTFIYVALIEVILVEFQRMDNFKPKIALLFAGIFLMSYLAMII